MEHAPLAFGVAVGTAVGAAVAFKCLAGFLIEEDASEMKWHYGEKAPDVTITGGTVVTRTSKYSQASQLVFASPRNGVGSGVRTWRVRLGDPASLAMGLVPDWIGVADPKGVMGNANSIGLASSGGVFRGGKLLRKIPKLWAGQTVGVTVDADAEQVAFEVDGEVVARVESDFKPYRLAVMLARPGEGAVLVRE